MDALYRGFLLAMLLIFTPLILERAIQAQFLVPLAAPLGVGILIATAVLMVLVPALMAVYLRVNLVRDEALTPVSDGQFDSRHHGTQSRTGRRANAHLRRRLL